jgi:Domain of unknown function (DUF4249)
MKNIKIIIGAFLILALQGCEKVITLDLKNTTPQLVIEGALDNSGGPAVVTLTKTINFTTANTFPNVSGAVVKIADNAGNIYTLAETSTGVYTNNTAMGVIGKAYTMTVTAYGKTYTATSTIPRQMPLDTLIQDVFDLGPGTDGGIAKSVNVFFRDLIGYGDNAHVLQKINTVPEALPFGISDDRFGDGGYVPFQIVNSRKKLKVGDVVEIELRFVDRNVYKYLTGILENAGGNTVPTNPTTNIIGGALGIFSAHTSEKKSITIR